MKTSNYLRNQSEIDLKGFKLADIKYKTITPTLIVSILGLLLMLFRTPFAIGAGLVLIILSIAVYVLIEDHRCLSIYEDGFVVFAQDNLCYQCSWDEVSEYRYISGTQFADIFEITMTDGEMIKTSLLTKRYVMKYFTDIIPEKDAVKKEFEKKQGVKIKFFGKKT